MLGGDKNAPITGEIEQVNSLIQVISIAPLLVHYYSKALPTQNGYCRSFTPKRHRQLRMKNLPKVPTWRLKRDSNPRPFGRKATNLPMSHHDSKLIKSDCKVI